MSERVKRPFQLKELCDGHCWKCLIGLVGAPRLEPGNPLIKSHLIASPGTGGKLAATGRIGARACAGEGGTSASE